MGTVPSWRVSRVQITLPVAPHFGQLSDIAFRCVLFPTGVGRSPLLVGNKVSPQSQSHMPGVHLPLPPSQPESGWAPALYLFWHLERLLRALPGNNGAH